MSKKDKKSNAAIRITSFTDPYCTWCWGSEPVIRKIMEVYGDQVEVDYVMGGLVKDMAEFSDPANGIGGKDWYKQVAHHWLDASGRHGMPVDEQVFYLLKDTPFSTYPASVAFKAAEFQGGEISKRYLRRLREATSAERQLIDRLDVQLRLAEEVGLDAGRLREDIESGRAGEAFEEDLKLCRQKGVRGFPTFSIESTGQSIGQNTGQSTGQSTDDAVILNGYVEYPKFDYWIGELSGHRLVKKDINRAASADASPATSVKKSDIYNFIERYGKVASVEVATVFDIDRAEAKAVLDAMAEGGLITATEAGNGHFFSPRESVACDTVTGTCS